MARKHLTLEIKLAAALLALKDDQGTPLIVWGDAMHMTPAQIISLFQFDHWPIRVEAGGSDHPSNLRPLLIAQHRTKTKKDAGEIAKIKRVSKKEDAFRKLILTPRDRRSVKWSHWPKRPMRRK